MLHTQESEQISGSSNPRKQLPSLIETNSALSAKQGRCHKIEVDFVDCTGLTHHMPCISHRLGPKGCEHKPLGLSRDQVQFWWLSRCATSSCWGYCSNDLCACMMSTLVMGGQPQQQACCLQELCEKQVLYGVAAKANNMPTTSCTATAMLQSIVHLVSSALMSTHAWMTNKCLKCCSDHSHRH